MEQNHGGRAVDAGETRKESKAQRELSSILFVCLFYCFPKHRGGIENQSQRRKEKQQHSLYPASREAVGGRKTEGERNPQLLSGPLKSSSSTLCWGAEDVINSEAEGGSLE